MRRHMHIPGAFPPSSVYEIGSAPAPAPRPCQKDGHDNHSCYERVVGRYGASGDGSGNKMSMPMQQQVPHLRPVVVHQLHQQEGSPSWPPQDPLVQHEIPPSQQRAHCTEQDNAAVALPPQLTQYRYSDGHLLLADALQPQQHMLQKQQEKPPPPPEPVHAVDTTTASTNNKTAPTTPQDISSPANHDSPICNSKTDLDSIIIMVLLLLILLDAENKLSRAESRFQNTARTATSRAETRVTPCRNLRPSCDRKNLLCLQQSRSNIKTINSHNNSSSARSQRRHSRKSMRIIPPL